MDIDSLITIIGILVFLLTITWGIIAYSLTYRNIKTKDLANVKKKIIDSIAAYFLTSGKKNANYWLKDFLNTKSNYLVVPETFLKVNNIFKTTERKNLKTFAVEIGLNHNIAKDLKSDDWYTKARAIMYCYELGLNSHIKTISSFRNHDHILVRRESQIAIVVLLGWKSLNLFPYIEYPISLWQQIRIIEKLKQYHPVVQEQHLEKAMIATNPYIKELLVRIIRTFELDHFKNYIIEQLYTQDQFLPESALKSLARFDLDQNEIEEIIAASSRIPSAPLRHRTLALMENRRLQ